VVECLHSAYREFHPKSVSEGISKIG